MDSLALDADELVARAVGSVASRRGHGQRGVRKTMERGEQLLPVTHDNDDEWPSLHSRGVSLNRLRREEEEVMQQHHPVIGFTAKRVHLGVDSETDELTAIQRLVDTQYADGTSSSECQGTFFPPPRHVASSHVLGLTSREPTVQRAGASIDGIDCATTCSVGVQCDMGVAWWQQGQQERLHFSGEPEAAARLLAQRIRELEVRRVGHSAAFASPLLQAL